MSRRYLSLAWRAMTVRGRFDGVEAHVLFPTGLIGLLVARLRRIPLVVYAHGSDVQRTARKNPIYLGLARLVATSAAAVVTNSEANARFVRELGREAEVIPPGVDLSRFAPSPRPSSRRVLYLGGSRPEKGPDRAAGVADTMAGPGIREVAPDGVPALIAEHDVVLVPSRREGFGLVAAEAIASGRWVVAAAVGGLTEVVTDGVNGTIVDDDDFAGAISRVPDYDPLRVSESASRFSIEVHRERMRAVWERVTMGSTSSTD